MTICETCRGLGTVPDPEIKGSAIRCKDCGGTGRKPETTHQGQSKKQKEA